MRWPPSLASLLLSDLSIWPYLLCLHFAAWIQSLRAQCPCRTQMVVMERLYQISAISRHSSSCTHRSSFQCIKPQGIIVNIQLHPPGYSEKTEKLSLHSEVPAQATQHPPAQALPSPQLLSISTCSFLSISIHFWSTHCSHQVTPPSCSDSSWADGELPAWV